VAHGVVLSLILSNKTRVNMCLLRYSVQCTGVQEDT